MAGSGNRPLRLVLDTNIVVAGLLWNGPQHWRWCQQTGG